MVHWTIDYVDIFYLPLQIYWMPWEVWDGIERYKRRYMELETHQVCEEANNKWLAFWFPHSPLWPPHDDKVALRPTWCLHTPPTLTNTYCFKHEPVVSTISPLFCTWACCFEHEHIILDVSLLFKCNLWMTATLLTMTMNATKPWNTGHVNSSSLATAKNHVKPLWSGLWQFWSQFLRV